MPNTILNDPTAGNNAAAYPSQARPDKGDIDAWVAGFNGTGVVSGAAVSVAASLAVAVAAGSFLVAGAPYSQAANPSLAVVAANPANPRVDLVVWDSSVPGYLVIAGNAATIPAWPTYNPATQILLAAVTVQAAMPALATGNLLDKRVLLNPAFSLPLLNVRQTSTHTTASLAAAAQEQSAITLAKSYRVIRVATSAAARVRLYDRAAKQPGDAGRAIGSTPSGDHGLMYEFVGAPALLSMDASPPATGSSMEATPTTSIPLTVDNLSGATAAITVTLTFFAME